MPPKKKKVSSITQEQWDASECLLKKTSRQRVKGIKKVKTEYSLCPHCEQNLAFRSSDVELECMGLRCPTMKPNEPTMQEFFDDFVENARFSKHEHFALLEETFDLYMHSLSRVWQCTECDFRETPESAAHAYAIAHGASGLEEHLTSFCSYFVIRRAHYSDYKRKTICGIMVKLADYLLEKGMVEDAERIKLCKKELRNSGKLECCKIMDALCSLKDRYYWQNLPTVRMENDGNEEDYEYLYSDTFSQNLGLRVSQVGKDFWLFGGGEGDEFDDSSSDEDSTYTLRLPPEVAPMGVVGMIISCVGLGVRSDNGQCELFDLNGGVFQPNEIYGAVYPPY